MTPTTSTANRAYFIDSNVTSSPYPQTSEPLSAVEGPANAATACGCPRTAATANAAAVSPTNVDDVEEGKTFLMHLVRRFEDNFEEDELLDILRNEDAGQSFLTNLLVHDLVMDPNPFDGLNLPFMVTRGMNSTSITFISRVEQLRAAFAELDLDLESHGTDDESNNDASEEVVTVGEAVRQLFVDRHITIGVQNDSCIHSSSEGFDRDVFDTTPQNASSNANTFYARLKFLAERFAAVNPTFTAAADAARQSYIQDHSQH